MNIARSYYDFKTFAHKIYGSRDLGILRLKCKLI